MFIYLLYWNCCPGVQKDKREGNFPLQGVTVEFSQQRRFCFSLKSQQKYARPACTLSLYRPL